MSDEESASGRYAALAAHLEALASPTRLEILHALRAPLALHELRVSPSLTRQGERADRPLSRQSTTHHLDRLLASRLVRRTDDERYVLDAQRLFAMVDGLRELARLRPLVAPSADGTLEQAKDPRASLPPRPRLLVAYGREEGIGCALPPEEGGEIVIGRGAECALRLDHDPFASSENAAILRRDGRYLLRDLHARNGTWMDWTRLRPGETVPLEDGALIGAGRSLLVAQL